MDEPANRRAIQGTSHAQTIVGLAMIAMAFSAAAAACVIATDPHELIPSMYRTEAFDHELPSNKHISPISYVIADIVKIERTSTRLDTMTVSITETLAGQQIRTDEIIWNKQSFRGREIAAETVITPGKTYVLGITRWRQGDIELGRARGFLSAEDANLLDRRPVIVTLDSSCGTVVAAAERDNAHNVKKRIENSTEKIGDGFLNYLSRIGLLN